MTHEEMSFEEKVKTLKTYIQRVSDGEDMEVFRQILKKTFQMFHQKKLLKLNKE